MSELRSAGRDDRGERRKRGKEPRTVSQNDEDERRGARRALLFRARLQSSGKLQFLKAGTENARGRKGIAAFFGYGKKTGQPEKCRAPK